VELGGAKFILFFSSPRKKEEGNPTHIAASRQLAGQTTRADTRTKFAKELQSCLRTPAKLLHLSFK